MMCWDSWRSWHRLRGAEPLAWEGMKALRTSDGIVKVVYDHGDIASLHQLQHTVTANVASSTGHQDLLCHGSLGEERPFSAERCVKRPGVGTTAKGPERERARDTVTSALPLGTPCTWPGQSQNDIRRGTGWAGCSTPWRRGSHLPGREGLSATCHIPGEKPLFFLLNPVKILVSPISYSTNPSG